MLWMCFFEFFLFFKLFIVVFARHNHHHHHHQQDDYNEIGYFWQITDMHYHPRNLFKHFDYKKGCGNHESFNNNPSSSSTLNREKNKVHGKVSSNPASLLSSEIYGEYYCDSSWLLIESAAQFMKSIQSDNVEFVLWTGDALSHFAVAHLSTKHQLELVQSLSDLLLKTFPSQFIFPVLGHDDAQNKRELGHIWSRWLPTDSIKAFEKGGYYIIERKQKKLQIIVLNTDLMRKHEGDLNATEQWKWLEKVLNKIERTKNQTVFLVGHVPPGRDERHKGPSISPIHKLYNDYHNKKFIEIVKNYSSIIVGQFFGHLHSDSFRIFYNDNGRPISWAMISPSITPKRSHMGVNNPSLRLYKFNRDTGHVYDYTQFYLDLSKIQSASKLEWNVEYNFTSYYGLNEINPENLNNLAKKFISYDDDYANLKLFERYFKANNVKEHAHQHHHYHRIIEECNLNCQNNHFCTITNLDYNEFNKCFIKRTHSVNNKSSANKNYFNNKCFKVLIITSVLIIMIIYFH